MIETKLIEIRDRMTFIPALATSFTGDDGPLLRRAGYGIQPYVILTRLDQIESQYDPYGWRGFRTMGNAHMHLIDTWDTITSGDVVDVEFILGETAAPKPSDAY